MTPPIPRPTWIELDLDALAGNLRATRARLGPSVQIMAVVKANAYGHGAIEIARGALSAGAARLGVAALNEALALRDAGIRAPILVLGYTPAHLVPLAIAHNITLTLYDKELAQAYLAAAAGRRLRVHLKVDTGMGRLGASVADAPMLAAWLATQRGFDFEGLFTHFARADERDQSFTDLQLERLRTVLGELTARGLRPPLVHAANSAAIFLRPDSHFDMVRLGIALYGINPSTEVACPSGFRPVLSFKTTVAYVKRVEAGTPLSYGGTYITPSERLIATLPVGYADGFRRAPQRWGHVLIHSHPAPLVARVCMDQILVDVTDVPHPVHIGDEVVLIGTQGALSLSTDTVAEWLGTNAYEVVTSLAARVPRIITAPPPH